MEVSMSSVFSVTGLYYTAIAVVVAVALAFSVNAFAGSQPKENLEAVVQIHAQVGNLRSMSDLNKTLSVDKTFNINIAVNQCKELRGNDPQCEADGTEPILAGLEYSFARNDGALIPKGMGLKKGDMITTEKSEGKPLIIAKKHEQGDCEWTHPFKLMGSGRVECKDDEANGYEDTITYMKRYPLKHLPESTATHEDGTPLTKLEQYRLKAVVKPVSEDAALGVLNDAQQAPDVTVKPLEEVKPITNMDSLSSH